MDKYTEAGAEVAIHEAGLPLMPGESIDDFRDAMESALSTFWATRGIQDTDETGWFFQRDLFADSVIVRIRPASGPARMVQQNFVRDANGEIRLGDPVEVRAVTSFVPVNTPAQEQVENATSAQRRDLPPAAFAIPFFAAEDGSFKASGTAAEFRRSLSALPHHVNTVSSATENATVDVRRLRNALARASQISTGGSRRFPTSAVREGVSHVQGHADAILRSRQRGSREQLEIYFEGLWYEVIGGGDALERLRNDREDLRSGLFEIVRARQKAEGIWSLAATATA